MEGFDTRAVREALAFPADAEVVVSLAVGRAAEADPLHPEWAAREPDCLSQTLRGSLGAVQRIRILTDSLG